MSPAEIARDGAATEAWRSVRRLLVVRLDNLGDVLMATPAVSALRAGLPAAHIAALVSPSGAAALPYLPDLDAAIVFSAPWVQSQEARSSADMAPPGRAEAELVARLASEAFDAAVILTTCTQSPLPAALVCRMAGIPLRLAHCRENPYALLTDWRRESDAIGDGMRHEVERQRALVRSVGFAGGSERLQFAVRPSDREAVADRLGRAGLRSGSRYVVVHPGASAESRRYPAARFGVAARRIAEASGRTVVFTGGAADRPFVDEAVLAMAAPAIALVGTLGLGELAALIEGADVLVANNSGPAHLAAAVGTPVVDLYALTNPQHTPWQVPARVLNHPVACRNCLKSRCPEGHHDCLRRVEPQAVVDAALDLIALAAPRPAFTPSRLLAPHR